MTMTTTNFKEETLEKFENLSVKDLKDMIKENSETSGNPLPVGMWKMNKDQLIEELNDIYADFIDEDDQVVVEEEIEKVVEATKENEIENKEKVARGRRSKKVKMVNSENGETIVFDKADDAHKWLKANYNLGYNHIKQSAEGNQTKKLENLNITFEWLKED